MQHTVSRVGDFVCLNVGLAAICVMSFVAPAEAAGCDPLSIPVLYATVSPHSAGTEPDTWVPQGRTVHLTGESLQINILSNCDTTTTPASFSWSAQFQGLGPVLPVPFNLSGASTTTPSFVAATAGVYFVTFQGPTASQTLRIESSGGSSVWVPIGPAGIDSPAGALTAVGRANVIIADVNTPSTYYVGTAQGGVFRSMDRGAEWWPISEHAGVPAMEVSALASAGDGALYAGFGERGNCLLYTSDAADE